ncbi:MAG TPA: cytochrome c oxidase subunit I [Burkholderiales bacterium]|nr:cytochrome c oxidase subunit I [Burkholderiales bacterium]
MRARHEDLEPVWRTPPGIAALTGVNHTTVGLRYVVTGFAFFLIGGVLAMLMRSQLTFAGNTLLDHHQYNAAFTLHGTVMMFFFAVPILLGFSAYLVPKMVGARDLIFPRLSAFGYFCYLFGGLLLMSSVVYGEPPTGGWFMYTPLSSRPFTPDSGPDFWLLGVTFAEISAVAGAVELIATIFKGRVPGMTLARMPLFVWAILVTAFMIVFAFPPLILGSILLEVERAFGLPFYDAARGGDPILWQHLFWLFGHPEVYIIFLPAAGIVSTIIPTFARLPMIGYRWVVVALVATGFLSFGLWVHHMYAVDIPLVSLSFFSAASMAVVIPTGIQVFAWIATLWHGRPEVRAPLVFVMGFFFVFVLGGLTGVMVALVPFDWQAHDTHFVVAHLHYVLFGGMVFPLLAGLYYWLPLVSGKRLSDFGSRLVFWLVFVGFNLTFLPMHLTGLVGMPRRVYTYADGMGWDLLNFISTVGGFLTAAGIGAFLVDLALQGRFSRRARPNPWNAGTLEWAMPSPVPSYNFVSQPRVEDRDPLWRDPELGARQQRAEFYLGHAPVKRREMLVTGALSAEPEQVAILPGNTWVPLFAALFMGVFFVGVLAQVYAIAILGIVLAAGAFLAWAWKTPEGVGGERDMDAGLGARLPLHHTVARSPGWWGTAIVLFADAALYGSLIYAHLFLWTVSPSWPPPGYLDVGFALPAVALAILALSSVAVQWRQYGLAAALAVAAAVLQSYALAASGLAPGSHAYSAVVFMLWTVQAVHIAIAVAMALFTLRRRAAGYDEAQVPAVTRLFWHYMVAQWGAGFAVVHLFPFVAA